MMSTYFPTIFGGDLLRSFDRDFFRDFGDVDRVLYGKHAQNMMKTDVRENEDGYQVAVDLPGFKKEEIKLELENGYLTISAEKSLEEHDEKDGKLLRQERYTGTMRRSFYVGEQLTEEDIKASYEDGVLRMSVPKKPQQALPAKKTICIA